MSTESSISPGQQIAAGYVAEGPALELGTVVVDDAVDPGARIRIPLATVNRHGLVAGATGTGKTKSLQVMAEQLSAAGVPVMMADIKGDLSGLSRPGAANDKTAARAKDTGDDWAPAAFPVEFLSLGTGGVGVPPLRSKRWASTDRDIPGRRGSSRFGLPGHGRALVCLCWTPSGGTAKPVAFNRIRLRRVAL